MAHESTHGCSRGDAHCHVHEVPVSWHMHSAHNRLPEADLVCLRVVHEDGAVNVVCGEEDRYQDVKRVRSSQFGDEGGCGFLHLLSSIGSCVDGQVRGPKRPEPCGALLVVHCRNMNMTVIVSG